MKSNEISDEYFVSISFEIGELFLLLFNQILEENDEHLDYLKGFVFFLAHSNSCLVFDLQTM